MLYKHVMTNNVSHCNYFNKIIEISANQSHMSYNVNDEPYNHILVYIHIYSDLYFFLEREKKKSYPG